MKLRKVFTVIVTAALIAATFTGCKSSDYKKAKQLMEQGSYGEAKAMFESLGNYKDAPACANDAFWNILYDHYYSDGSQSFSDWFKNPDYTVGSVSMGIMHSLFLDTDDDRTGIELMYSEYIETDSTTATSLVSTTIYKDKPEIEIIASVSLNDYTYSASVTMDKSSIKPEDTYDWGNFQSDPSSAMSSSLKSSIGTVLTNVTNFMFEDLVKTFEQEDITVTMADVGFTGYN